MPMTTPVAVVVPIYKKYEMLDATEKISLLRCLKILKKHKIIFIGAIHFNTQSYQNICLEYQVNFSFRGFDARFFEGRKGYNALLLHIDFYNAFADFSHILIYQTDCYVFTDALLHWVAQPQSYIGAPWTHVGGLQGVGNGGFSLRRVADFIFILDNINHFEQIHHQKKWLHNFDIPIKVNLRGRLKNWVFYVLGCVKLKNNVAVYVHNFSYNEDIFWGKVAPQLWSGFALADNTSAVRFAF
jgi:hypothetical protein